MNDFTLLLPEFMLTGLAFLVLVADLVIRVDRKPLIPYTAIVGLGGVLAFSLVFLWGDTGSLYGGLLRIDGYALFFKAVLITIGIFIVLSSIDYVKKYLDHPGEYYGILVFTILGMVLLASSAELLTAYISLELLSFGLYALVGFDRYNPKSNEASTKYILLGAVSSAIMLYGISQIYGLLGTTRFDEIAISLAALPELSPGLIIGIVFLISGLAFKIAAVPFHMWAPDVYEGAPTPITAYLAVGSKAAAFALILRLFSEALIPSISDWQIIIAIFAALTMTIGNLGALVQTNIKRLLAYSSIGHVGYLLLGIAALARVDGGETVSVATMHLAANGVMLHIVAYAAANLTVFLVITAIYKTPGNEVLSGLAGLGRRSPFLAMVLAGSILSLAGLPVFAGFVSKFYLFTAAATQGLLWLVGIAIFTSLISLYYYLQILRQMYIEPAVDDTPVPISNLVLVVLGILFAGTVFIGIYPAPLVDAIQYASDAISTMSSGGVELAHTLDWAWRPLLDFTLDLA